MASSVWSGSDGVSSHDTHTFGQLRSWKRPVVIKLLLQWRRRPPHPGGAAADDRTSTPVGVHLMLRNVRVLRLCGQSCSRGLQGSLINDKKIAV